MNSSDASLRESVGLGPVDQPPKTWGEWDLEALCTANDEGVLGPFWQPKDYFDGISRLMGLLMRGLVRRRDGQQGGPWMITDAGRAHLRQVALTLTSESTRKDASPQINHPSNAK